MSALRWKRDPRVRFDPPSHTLRANGIRHARVTELRTGGWYWVAGWEARALGVPHMNTADAPYDTEAEAKAAALAYVRAALARPSR